MGISHPAGPNHHSEFGLVLLAAFKKQFARKISLSAEIGDFERRHRYSGAAALNRAVKSIEGGGEDTTSVLPRHLGGISVGHSRRR